MADPNSETGSRFKRLIIFAVLLVVAFLLGWVPMWLEARDRAGERDAALRQLRAAKLQGALANAAVQARRGEYEPARQSSSEFFTALREELERQEDHALEPAQREALRPLLDSRDELITLLARGDPAAAERLSDLYVSYLRAVQPPEPGNAALRPGAA